MVFYHTQSFCQIFLSSILYPAVFWGIKNIRPICVNFPSGSDAAAIRPICVKFSYPLRINTKKAALFSAAFFTNFFMRMYLYFDQFQ
ncbi:MAG TPA: hypothetical protein PLI57_11280 [Spirochaetota bacterium]|nr:hypothetical protein [Spirochaetota bacterium]